MYEIIASRGKRLILMQKNTMIIPRCVQPHFCAKTAKISLIQGRGGILAPDSYSMYSAKSSCATLRMYRIGTFMLTSILAKMKMLLTLSILLFLLNACSQPNDRPEEEKQIPYAQPTNIDQNMEPISELTLEQQSAFDALNTLQVSTDEMNRLYSTFSGIVQPCYPPDTSLTISQTELLMAMKQFVTSNCRNLSVEERDELAARAVLAQEEYPVSLCLDNSAPVTYENGVPMTGTWVMPSVLDRRDVIIVWSVKVKEQ